MTTIHLIDGEKGGTGKSWVARLLHHHMTCQQTPFLGVEADQSNPTYKDVYKNAQRIVFSLHPNEVDYADALYEMALENDLIVSLPAQVHRAVTYWLITKGVINLLDRKQITVKKWWVSDGEDDSLKLFVQSAAAMGAQVQHIFVCNEGRCPDWTYFERHLPTQEAIRKYKVPVVKLPELTPYRRIQMNAHHFTFAAAIANQDRVLGEVGAMVVEKYVNDTYAVFESAGAFGAPSEAAMTLANTDLGVVAEVETDGQAETVAETDGQVREKPVKKAA